MKGGNLLSSNAEVGGFPNGTSQIGRRLSAGNDYAAIGGYNTTWSAGFGAAAGGEAGAAGAGEVVWFSLGIVPEPSTIVLFALSGLALLHRRRA
jgi:hypothetical protein